MMRFYAQALVSLIRGPNYYFNTRFETWNWWKYTILTYLGAQIFFPCLTHQFYDAILTIHNPSRHIKYNSLLGNVDTAALGQFLTPPLTIFSCSTLSPDTERQSDPQNWRDTAICGT